MNDFQSKILTLQTPFTTYSMMKIIHQKEQVEKFMRSEARKVKFTVKLLGSKSAREICLKLTRHWSRDWLWISRELSVLNSTYYLTIKLVCYENNLRNLKTRWNLNFIYIKTDETRERRIPFTRWHFSTYIIPSHCPSWMSTIMKTPKHSTMENFQTLII